MLSHRLRSLSLIVVCGISALPILANDNSNQQLQTDKPYYFFNEAAGKYLTITGGVPTLGCEAQAITLSQDATEQKTGSYELSMAGKPLSTVFQGGATLDGGSGKWLIKPVDGKDGIYTIACRDYNAETADYLYWSTVQGELATQYTEPSLGGEWKLDETPCVVLDETSTTYTKPNIEGSTTVRLLRTLTIGSWNTLCLPFAISIDKLKEQWGDDMEVVEFSALNGTVLHFKDVSASLEAGKPYLVRPTKQPDKSYYEFNDITTFASSVTECSQGSVAYKATFVKSTAPSRAYAIRKNVLYHLTSEMTLKGFRGYFWQTDPQASPLNFWTIDETPNDIHKVFASGKAVDIYTVDGVLVRSGATNADGLQRGIYVVEGHKFVVR